MTIIVNKSEYGAIIFDLDGVLVDSSKVVIRCWEEWADHNHIDINTILHSVYGFRTIETMRIVAPHLDAEKEAHQFDMDEINDTDGIVAMEGANNILQHLPENKWAIVTSCGKELVKARLRVTQLPTPRILITSDDVMNGKPDPEPYLLCARKLNIPPEYCMVIEDSPAGVIAGKKAGMTVIGISTTHPREELIKARADQVIGTLLELEIVTR